MKELDNFYDKLNEPVKGCFFALRQIILAQDEDVTHTCKYGMPFFCYKGKMFCYLWVDKKQQSPYIGFIEGNRIEHPALVAGNRSRIKILHINAEDDLPIATIQLLLQQALSFYKTGLIKIKRR